MAASGHPDPFVLLGLPADAAPDAIRATRRRMAKELHPDRGGDARRMQELNQATVDALAIATAAPEPLTSESVDDPYPFVPANPPVPRAGSPVVEDQPSFVVEALPSVAFEAIVAISRALGVIVDHDPPYVLDIVLHDPFRCWCRLEVLPEGGTSSVSLLLAGLDGLNPPETEAVRDVWIAALNAGPVLPAC
ncbi:MAG: hypothetical protein M3337_05155 [Actinomycetota bacterium]|nr:hypothetical protein [Actinomycetota bacterium]